MRFALFVCGVVQGTQCHPAQHPAVTLSNLPPPNLATESFKLPWSMRYSHDLVVILLVSGWPKALLCRKAILLLQQKIVPEIVSLGNFLARKFLLT